MHDFTPVTKTSSLAEAWKRFRAFAGENKDAVSFIVLVLGALGGAYLFMQKIF